MRPPSLTTPFYAPGDPPADPQEMRRYAYEEFQKIQATLALLAVVHLEVLTAAPTKPRDGRLCIADGTHWNPGGGKGLYCFTSLTWTLIKALP